jgi:hypothetical protein
MISKVVIEQTLTLPSDLDEERMHASISTLFA